MMQNFQTLKAYDYISPAIAKANGISKASFYKFVRDNAFEKAAHGIYTASDNFVDDLYILHQRCPQAVFSHDEAFYYYGLTDREPIIHTLTIYSGYNSHRLTAEGKCKVYTVKKELLNLGKITVTDYYGNKVPMYDIDRTLCDLIRSRNSIEIQDFKSVLTTYVTRREKNLYNLAEYAKQFKILNIIQKYMEILL